MCLINMVDDSFSREFPGTVIPFAVDGALLEFELGVGVRVEMVFEVFGAEEGLIAPGPETDVAGEGLHASSTLELGLLLLLSFELRVLAVDVVYEALGVVELLLAAIPVADGFLEGAFVGFLDVAL